MESDAGADDEAIDRVVIERLGVQVGGDAGIVGRLLATFASEAASLGVAAAKAAAERDGEALRRVAHRLSGSGAVVGARAVVACSAAIGQAVRDGDWPSADAAVARLSQAIERTGRAFARLR